MSDADYDALVRRREALWRAVADRQITDEKDLTPPFRIVRCFRDYTTLILVLDDGRFVVFEVDGVADDPPEPSIEITTARIDSTTLRQAGVICEETASQLYLLSVEINHLDVERRERQTLRRLQEKYGKPTE